MRRGSEARDMSADFKEGAAVIRDMRLTEKEINDKFNGDIEAYVDDLKTDREELNRVQLAVEKYLKDENPNDDTAKEIQRLILLAETGADLQATNFHS